jgi:hypothetical protein
VKNMPCIDSSKAIQFSGRKGITPNCDKVI